MTGLTEEQIEQAAKVAYERFLVVAAHGRPLLHEERWELIPKLRRNDWMAAVEAAAPYLAARPAGDDAARTALESIRRIASGEEQVALDDTEGMAIIDKLAVAALAQPEQGQTAIPMPKHWASSDPDGHRQAYADARADAEHSSRAREQGLGVDKTDEWEARQDADKQPGLFYYLAVAPLAQPEQGPEGRYRKNCHICGCLLTDGKCLSCGHEQCDECPVHVPKPSYEELEAECRRLREEAESGDEMYEALQVKFEGCPHHHDSPCACSYDAPGDVCSVHSPALRKAEAENAKLREALRPVTVTEFREYAHKDDWGVDCVYIGGCNELLSAKAQKAGL